MTIEEAIKNIRFDKVYEYSSDGVVANIEQVKELINAIYDDFEKEKQELINKYSELANKYSDLADKYTELKLKGKE